MREGLTPEQRTDVTGRTQTRWVRQQCSPSGKSIPSPVVPSAAADDHSAACDALMDQLDGVTLHYANRDELRSRLALLRPETVREALDLARGATRHTLASLAMELTFIDPDRANDDENLPYFAVEELYGRHWPLPMHPRAGSLIAAVRNLRRYSGLSSEESLPRRVAAAHMIAACEIWDRLNNGKNVTTDAGPWLLAEPALADVFEQHPERAMELAEIVIEHGPNVGVVLAHLRGNPLTLADGEL